MLVVPAFEFRDPIALVIHMKTDDAAISHSVAPDVGRSGRS
jgi:hypothetical protein